ncbi:hypothetical protein MKX03_012604 [Papaver bracteatum]|nr:hypothetical protein MKX03_012604 [Papaver bracteatum]
MLPYHVHITMIVLHSRIKDINGEVWQISAREATGLVVDMIRQKRMTGRALLLDGPPGTGKTTLALGIYQKLGSKVPFCLMVGSEVYSSEVKKTEVLMENFRRAIGLRMKENKEVYEGEVTELSPEEAESIIGGYGNSISHVIIGLKTFKGTKKFKLDPTIYDVAVGDVIYIEANNGAVKRAGRSDDFATEFDLEAEEYVVNSYFDEGVAELVPGVLFIDEVHMLDMECFSYMNRALEKELILVVHMAYLLIYLDRLAIIRTETYGPADMIQILAIRAQVEELVLDEESLSYLGEIGQQASLRHAFQLLSPASIVARMNGRDGICKADLEEMCSIYL